MKQGLPNWFIKAMRKTLKRNAADKDGWKDCSDTYLSYRLVQEVGELLEALADGGDPVGVTEEATDVSLIAMMLADNSGSHGV